MPTKVHLVKAMVFPLVHHGCESYTVKKTELQRIDAFELWCWRRLLRVPWTAKRSNQSILKEISSECSLEELMLKLKLQYFGHLMWRTFSCEKTLMLGKTEGRRRRGREDEMVGCHHQHNGHGFGWALGVGDGQWGLACCSPWGHKESDSTEQLNWIEVTSTIFYKQIYSLVLKKCLFSQLWDTGRNRPRRTKRTFFWDENRNECWKNF